MAGGRAGDSIQSVALHICILKWDESEQQNALMLVLVSFYFCEKEENFSEAKKPSQY